MIDRTVAVEVRRRKLTYLGPDRLDSLYDCIDAIQRTSTAGAFAEFGVALGGSGICLARARNGRKYFGFDVFGMIPPPSGADGSDVCARYATILSGKSSGIGGDKYYGYIDDLYEVVKSNFHSFDCKVDGETIILVKGLFYDTLPTYADLAIALAHIDCDWYQPVKYCLEYAWQRLTPGGFIILDDYNDWSGCRKATDEFLPSHPSAELIRTRPHAVIRRPA